MLLIYGGRRDSGKCAGFGGSKFGGNREDMERQEIVWLMGSSDEWKNEES
mgnify:FL=1